MIQRGCWAGGGDRPGPGRSPAHPHGGTDRRLVPGLLPELEMIYDSIDQLEPIEQEGQLSPGYRTPRGRRARYPVAAVVAEVTAPGRRNESGEVPWLITPRPLVVMLLALPALYLQGTAGARSMSAGVVIFPSPAETAVKQTGQPRWCQPFVAVATEHRPAGPGGDRPAARAGASLTLLKQPEDSLHQRTCHVHAGHRCRTDRLTPAGARFGTAGTTAAARPPCWWTW